ncbi:hypothetical protein LX36DRAFT_442223 [Colletotrichum falcatum]|nr:hypothetical protein LX36DRAFT_442223 [Colletotrichum falcatum]
MFPSPFPSTLRLLPPASKHFLVPSLLRDIDQPRPPNTSPTRPVLYTPWDESGGGERCLTCVDVWACEARVANSHPRPVLFVGPPSRDVFSPRQTATMWPSHARVLPGLSLSLLVLYLLLKSFPMEPVVDLHFHTSLAYAGLDRGDSPASRSHRRATVRCG